MLGIAVVVLRRIGPGTVIKPCMRDLASCSTVGELRHREGKLACSLRAVGQGAQPMSV